ncbi:MAG: hypothetical protein NUV73_01725 [Candidatus Daviesbacteria bacterium]|nr:hypothetical protein [Candidatus Daviesbacteria bacterium]
MGPGESKEVAVLERNPYESVLEQMRKEVEEGIGLLGKNEAPGDDLWGLRQVVDRFTRASEPDDPETQQVFTADSGLAEDAAFLRENPLKLAHHIEDGIKSKWRKGQVSEGQLRGVIAALDRFRDLYAVSQTPGQAATKMPAGLLQRAG